MSEMLQVVPNVQSALICVEAPLSSAGVPLALPRIFGKPAIFHQVKQLQRHGVREIIISVDAVPAELPQLIDQLRTDALDVRLMRSNGGSAEIEGFQSQFLLLSSDLWLQDKLLREALSWKSNSIAIVEEDPSNSQFERIDLNRRWSGIAILEAGFLDHSKNMPEGWNLASFLLRHALQMGAKEITIDQKLVTDGSLLKISNESEYEKVSGTILSTAQEFGMIESAIGKFGSRLISPVSHTSWLVTALDFTPAALSVVSTGLAYTNFPIGALIVLIFGLCLEVFRQQIRASEYRSKTIDYLRLVAQIAGFATVFIALWREGETVTDASFLTAMGLGLILMTQMVSKNRYVRFASPLAIALLLLLGTILGSLATMSKISLAAVLALNVWTGWQQRRKVGRLNSN